MISKQIKSIAHGYGIQFNIRWHCEDAEWVFIAESVLSDGKSYWIGDRIRGKVTDNKLKEMLYGAFWAFVRRERKINRCSVERDFQ